jgi:transcriptional regulator with XRE-family HTH domain
MSYALHQFACMTLGTRIKAAREARGWSQAMLGESVGKAQNTIWSWESGRTEPTRADVVRIASKLKIPLAELEDVLVEPPHAAIVRQIPLLSWVSAGQVADLGSLEEASAAERIAVADLPPGDYFATDVRGDSMDRVSPDGSRIIVNFTDKRLVAGKAYIFSLRGETTYKFYQPTPVPRLEPFSTNPAHRTIFLDERDTWDVIGRVWRSYIDLS